MSADVTLNGADVYEMSLHFPMNGAWTADISVASDINPIAGTQATLNVLDQDFVCRIDRVGSFADRLTVQVIGGTKDYKEFLPASNSRLTTVQDQIALLGLQLDISSSTPLPYWTRPTGTRGQAVQSLASSLGVKWRVLPDGKIRMRAETPTPIDKSRVAAVELQRDESRGLVTLSVEFAGILPGMQNGADAVGEVTYTLSDKLRCYYFTESRDLIREGFESIVRWVVRDAMFHSTYLCQVMSQNADKSLDLLPIEKSIKGNGLQFIPIRHGLPGTTVDVPAGEFVTLAFDGGSPAKPYCSLFNGGGRATKYTFNVDVVEMGGALKVALASLVDERLAAIQAKFDAHTHVLVGVANPGGLAVTGTANPVVSPIGPLEPTASEKLGTA